MTTTLLNTMRYILIIDEVSSASIYKPVTYNEFIEPSDNVSLLLITNHASEEDKTRCKEVITINTPTTNGLLEIHAFELHRKYGIDTIYTKQEDLILRASYLRKALCIKGKMTQKTLHNVWIYSGMQPTAALLFRDKEIMKRHLAERGIKTPPFERIYSPADVLTFTERHGFPIIIKPTLGSASAGITVLKSSVDCHKYLESDFYDRIDEKGKVMDYSGDLIIEAFVDGIMYHVNGCFQNNQLVKCWPFQYLETNLGFTQGKIYGNVSFKPSDAKYQKLYDFTLAVLNNLPCPESLVFHLELFEVGQDFLLCEIAARRPGGLKVPKRVYYI